MIEKKQLLTFVVPVFDETEVVDTCHEGLDKVAPSLTDLSHELIFVDDGSSDDRYEILQAIPGSGRHVRLPSPHVSGQLKP